MANDVWTDEQKAYLIAERAKGTPVPRIAAALGKPVPATYTRCRMLGSLIQPHTPWTAEQEARLRELATGPTPMSDQALADAVGKTVPQMRWKLGDLDLIGCRTKRPKKIVARARRDAAAADPRAAAVRAEEQRVRAERQATLRAEKARDAERARAQARLAREEAAEQRRAAKAAVAERAKAERIAAVAARAAERERAAAQARLERARSASTRRGVEPISPPAPIGLAPVAPRVEPPARTSGRGGWTQVHTGARRQQVGPAPTREGTLALSQQAGDAIARFMAERGVTRAAPDPVERAVTYLRRRGYVVVAQTDSQGIATHWTVDHRHVLSGAAALTKFAEARGYA